MTKVLAFDQSTLTGWAFGGTKIELRDWVAGHFRAPRRDEEGERLIIVHDSALALIDEYQPDLIAWETPFDPSWDAVAAAKSGKEPRANFNRATMNLLQRIAGALIMAAARRSIPTESYPPQAWRATLKLPKPPPELVYPKRSKWIKQQTVAAVRRMGGRVETEDEADAWGIALHALHGKAGIKRATEDLFEKARIGL